MEPAINLYSSNEKSELIRENSQEILSVLAAHQIALWEYDIITGECSFSDDYFSTLGLKNAGVLFEDIDSFYRFVHPDDTEAYKQAFAEMLSSDSKTSQIRVRCIGEQGKVVWLEDHFLSYKESCKSLKPIIKVYNTKQMPYHNRTSDYFLPALILVNITTFEAIHCTNTFCIRDFFLCPTK